MHLKASFQEKRKAFIAKSMGQEFTDENYLEEIAFQGSGIALTCLIRDS